MRVSMEFLVEEAEMAFNQEISYRTPRAAQTVCSTRREDVTIVERTVEHEMVKWLQNEVDLRQ